MVKTIILKVPSKEHEESIKLRDRVLMKYSDSSIMEANLSREGMEEVVLGAYVGGNIAGTSTCKMMDYDGKRALKTVFFITDDKYANQGVEEGLIIRMEYIAREMNADLLVLTVEEDSADSYLKHGYLPVGKPYTDELSGLDFIDMTKPMIKKN